MQREPRPKNHGSQGEKKGQMREQAQARPEPQPGGIANPAAPDEASGKNICRQCAEHRARIAPGLRGVEDEGKGGSGEQERDEGFDPAPAVCDAGHQGQARDPGDEGSQPKSDEGPGLSHRVDCVEVEGREVVVVVVVDARECLCGAAQVAGPQQAPDLVEPQVSRGREDADERSRQQERREKYEIGRDATHGRERVSQRQGILNRPRRVHPPSARREDDDPLGAGVHSNGRHPAACLDPRSAGTRVRGRGIGSVWDCLTIQGGRADHPQMRCSAWGILVVPILAAQAVRAGPPLISDDPHSIVAVTALG
jgi:hypothetical protein